jgi:DNA-binding MarR family transcriptional regulator
LYLIQTTVVLTVDYFISGGDQMEALQSIDIEKLCQLKVGERALLFTLQQVGGEAVSVTEAATLMNWAPYYTGKVLRSLLEKGLVKVRRYGNFRLYSVAYKN